LDVNTLTLLPNEKIVVSDTAAKFYFEPTATGVYGKLYLTNYRLFYVPVCSVA